jgi:hypothetical protein
LKAIVARRGTGHRDSTTAAVALVLPLMLNSKKNIAHSTTTQPFSRIENRGVELSIIVIVKEGVRDEQI